MTAAERARRVLAGWIREAVHATMSGSREAVATYADLEEMIADAIAAAERERADRAIELAVRYGGIDGAHHKAWVIDQMVRSLAGDRYADVVRDAKAGNDGPETYTWDEGAAP